MRPVSFPVNRMAGEITVPMMLMARPASTLSPESARCSALSAGFPFIHEQGAEPVGTSFLTFSLPFHMWMAASVSIFRLKISNLPNHKEGELLAPQVQCVQMNLVTK